MPRGNSGARRNSFIACPQDEDLRQNAKKERTRKDRDTYSMNLWPGDKRRPGGKSAWCPKLDKERVRRTSGEFSSCQRHQLWPLETPTKPRDTDAWQIPSRSQVGANPRPKSEQKLRRRRTQGVSHSSKFFCYLRANI
ncbi:uncharacterized protein LOC113563740 [Drosophila erecta]|uniref:uncharacterized protein LOC113563740 n=1 Tax=Drosophila erecta TaxID=7220 RepID=UPI000F06BB6B|nr:uncharacterized protein LOC113563740 [Drosophila erecta]